MSCNPVQEWKETWLSETKMTVFNYTGVQHEESHPLHIAPLNSLYIVHGRCIYIYYVYTLSRLQK